jgi:hypothetical protein
MKYYGRHSTIIYPPVDVARFTDVSLPPSKRLVMSTGGED